MRAVTIASWATLGSRHATVGDLLAVRVVVNELRRNGLSAYHVLEGEPMPGLGEGFRIWVCGPVDFSYDKQQAVLGRDGAGWIVSSASVIRSMEATPVLADLSTARDLAGSTAKADFAILAPATAKARRAAVMLRGHQPEYRQDHSIHLSVERGVRDALRSTGHFPLALGTACPDGLDPEVAAAGIEDLFSSSDVVITSRLHGIIHALRAGKYPVVIDEIVNGGKVSACALAFGIPFLLPGEDFARQVVSAIESCRCRSAEEVAQLRETMQASARDNLNRMLRLVSSNAESGSPS